MKKSSRRNGRAVCRTPEIEAAIRREIETGVLVDRVPTDATLARRFRVNVKTVAMAMSRLSAQGLVSRRRRAARRR